MADTTSLKIVKNFKKTIQQANGYEIYTVNWSGEYDELLNKTLEYPLGYKAEADIDVPELSSDAIVIANTLTRREGKLADLSVSFSSSLASERKWFCSFDMIAVPKDIRTWKPSDKNEEPPNLTQIQYWEGTKESEPELYAQYKYREPAPDGSPEGTLGEIKTLEENTKKLAEMIFQGVNNYTIHAPCLTINTYDVTISPARLYYKYIDHQVESSELSAEVDKHSVGNLDIKTLIKELANVWIMTDFKATTQANGLSQLTIRWIGADEAREELYPKEESL